MARRFTISCFGSVNAQPLDQKKIAHHCFGLLTPSEVQQVFESAPTSGRWLFLPTGSQLTIVRKVNKKLHELGIETVIHVFDSSEPQKMEVFVDERKQGRRASIFEKPAAVVPLSKEQERRAQRARGRRKEDKEQ